MKNVKKLLAATGASAAYIVSTSVAFADNVTLCPQGSFQGGICKTPGIQASLNRIFNILIIAGILIALGFLIYGGIKWIMSGGDKAKVQAARDTIIGAIIGLIIVLVAYFLVTFVYKLVTGNDFGNFDLPSLLGYAALFPLA